MALGPSKYGPGTHWDTLSVSTEHNRPQSNSCLTLSLAFSRWAGIN
jgi:hypothetical protein